MSEPYSLQGKTTVAPEVLLTIAQLATLEVEGVSRMSRFPVSATNKPDVLTRLFQRGQAKDGVHIEISDDVVYVNLYVVLKNDVNVREVSRNIQREVNRAITEMVGMQVGRVNVHIEDIDYPVENEA